MIRLIDASEQNELMDLLVKDKIVNYFVLLGFFGDASRFSKIFGFFDQNRMYGVLAIRHSGNAQMFCLSDVPNAQLDALIAEEGVKAIIADQNQMPALIGGLGGIVAYQADVMTVTPQTYIKVEPVESIVWRPCMPEDAHGIKALYTICFNGSLSESGIAKNLQAKTGRGFCVEQDGVIIAVAQSIFEDETSAIIYGVATHPERQGQGYSTTLLSVLFTSLQSEGKTLELMVENPIAFALYEKFGFIKRTRIEKLILSE